MQSITYTQIVNSGILKELITSGQAFVIKMKGLPDAIVTPEKTEGKPKKRVVYSQTLTIPQEYISNKDFSNYDFTTPLPARPIEHGETYATFSYSTEQYFNTNIE